MESALLAATLMALLGGTLAGVLAGVIGTLRVPATAVGPAGSPAVMRPSLPTLAHAGVLVGLAAEGRRAARAGAAVRTVDGTEVGTISSGALSPTLGHPIAMAFVRPDLTEAGTELVVDVRGKDLPVRVVDLPFYSRS